MLPARVTLAFFPSGLLRVIAVHKIVKTFRPRFLEFTPVVPVLKDFSMTAHPGQVTGLVGANGAGKTTLFRILVGLEPIDSGAVRIDGLDSQAHPEAVRGKIALLPEKPALGTARGLDVLQRFGILQGLSSAEIRRRLEFITRELDLGEFIKRPASTCSRGQAVRLSLARLHLMDASTFIFDEPTVGLDFESAARVRGWIRSLAKEGHTVLLTSHLMSDLQGLCDAMVGLRDGVEVSPQSLTGWDDALEAFRGEG